MKKYKGSSGRYKKLTKSISKIVHVPFEEVYPHGFEEIPNRRP